jgi:hypothetical protein
MIGRVKGWEKALKAVITKHQALPSQYGVSDCYLICDDAVEAITGSRMFPDVSYTTEQGAAKQLLLHGFKTVEDAFMFKFPTVPVSLAQRGDIGVMEENGVVSGGVFVGIGFMCRDVSKVVFLPISRVKTAFKVGRT